MRHLVPFRVYESKNTSGLTSEQKDFLNRYTQGTWSVNPTTGLVDIQGKFFFRTYINKEAKSFFGVKFGNVTEDFDCLYTQLESLEGAPQKVDGNFVCSDNGLQSLAGAPQKVFGDFNCSDNGLQSLAGAPQEIGGEFQCDEFQLDPGEWNMDGWLEVLENGSEEAKKLIITLPYLDSNFWNSKISQNPESTIIELSGFWDDMPDNIRNSIRIPSNMRDDFYNLLELMRAGIM